MSEKNQGRGFSGLDSLVSQVEAGKASPAARTPGEATVAPNAKASATAKSQPNEVGIQGGTRNPRSGGRSRIAWALAGGACVLLVLFSNIKSDAPKTAAGLPPSPVGTATSTYETSQPFAPPTYPTPSTSASEVRIPQEKIYRVPHYMVAELDANRVAADAAQRTAEQLAAQVRSARLNLEAHRTDAELARSEVKRLGAEIESERAYLTSTSDESDIANLNSKVDQYNAHLSRARRLSQDADNLINPYNALVARSNRQAELANRLVDTYNDKLQRYGR